MKYLIQFIFLALTSFWSLNAYSQQEVEVTEIVVIGCLPQAVPNFNTNTLTGFWIK